MIERWQKNSLWAGGEETGVEGGEAGLFKNKNFPIGGGKQLTPASRGL